MVNSGVAVAVLARAWQASCNQVQDPSCTYPGQYPLATDAESCLHMHRRSRNAQTASLGTVSWQPGGCSFHSNAPGDNSACPARGRTAPAWAGPGLLCGSLLCRRCCLCCLTRIHTHRLARGRCNLGCCKTGTRLTTM
eukprot:363237-Chlamydomonas_euryale.AAC.3